MAKQYKADFQRHKLFDLNFNYPKGNEITINRGGTSSGKTFTLMFVIFCTAYKDKGSITTVVGQDMPNLKVGAWRDAETILQNSDMISSWVYSVNQSSKTIKLRNGSIIEFKSYENEQDAKSGKRDYSFFNEVNGISYEIFEQIFIRTRKHTWVDFNPSGSFWLKEKGYERRKGVRTLISTYKHNPWLEQSIVDKIEGYEPLPDKWSYLKEYTKQEAYEATAAEENQDQLIRCWSNEKAGTASDYRWKVYGLGEYAPLEGAIFKRWKRGKYREDLSDIYWIDWGFTDPFAFGKLAVDHQHRKIYVKQLKYATEQSSSQIRRAVGAHCSPDHLIICDSANPMSIKDLRDHDFNARAAYKPKVSVRVAWLQDYLWIVDDSPDIEDELNAYVWADKKSETPVDANNHALDGIGYAYTFWRMNVYDDAA